MQRAIQSAVDPSLLQPVDPKAHARAVMRASLTHYRDSYPHLCARCIVTGELDGGQICPCYVTRAPWQVAAFKAVESVACEALHRMGWYEGGAQPAKGSICLECEGSPPSQLPAPPAERELMALDPWSGT
jgi:hypothetical protein